MAEGDEELQAAMPAACQTLQKGSITFAKVTKTSTSLTEAHTFVLAIDSADVADALMACRLSFIECSDSLSTHMIVHHFSTNTLVLYLQLHTHTHSHTHTHTHTQTNTGDVDIDGRPTCCSRT